MSGMHVVLVGPMGVGKTTVGRALADRLGRPLRDSDDELVAEQGRSGRDLAAVEGVDVLHRWEAEHLRRALAAPEPSVVAAAASVVDDPASRRALRDHTVVWLRAPAATLAERAGASGHRRTLGSDPEGSMEALAAERGGRYAEVADLTVDTGATGPEGVVAAILDRLAGPAAPDATGPGGDPAPGDRRHLT
jgi:shikimate kinase